MAGQSFQQNVRPRLKALTQISSGMSDYADMENRTAWEETNSQPHRVDKIPKDLRTRRFRPNRHPPVGF